MKSVAISERHWKFLVMVTKRSPSATDITTISPMFLTVYVGTDVHDILSTPLALFGNWCEYLIYIISWNVLEHIRIIFGIRSCLFICKVLLYKYTSIHWITESVNANHLDSINLIWVTIDLWSGGDMAFQLHTCTW